MDEFAARFELLKAEMADLQQGIRHYDTIILQIRGWAVTVGLAAAGLSLTTQEALAALLGLFSSAAFLVIDGGRRSVQRVLIRRVLAIEAALADKPILEALRPESGLVVPRLGHTIAAGPGRGRLYRHVVAECSRPSVWSLYATLSVLLVGVALTA